MQRHETDAAYFTRRAHEETEMAAQADRPDVAAAHRGLAQQYAEMASRLGLAVEATADEAAPSPFFHADARRDRDRPRGGGA